MLVEKNFNAGIISGKTNGSELESDSIKEFMERLNASDNFKGKLDTSVTELPAVTKDIIENFMKKPTELKFNAVGEVYYVNSLEETVIVDPGSEMLPDIQNYIKELIPVCPFDLERNGISSQQIEVEALYKVLLINTILEGAYSVRIKAILEDYDFVKVRGNEGTLEFKELLKDICERSNTVMRLLISCINDKLTSNVSKNEAEHVKHVSETATTAFKILRNKLKSQTAPLNEQIEKEKNKIKRLQLIKLRDEIVDKLVCEDDDIRILYLISTLTTDSLPILTVNALRDEAEAESKRLQKEKIIIDARVARDFEVKLKRRALKALNAHRKVGLYKRYALGEREILIPKL
jgi:hypothetical protein